MIKLTDKQEWRVLQMSRDGGFSTRFISKLMFGMPNLDSVTIDQVSAVRRCLHRHKARLKDWRDGLSPLSLSHAKTVTVMKRITTKKKTS